MAGVNKVILIGNLGQDPETRYTKGGDAVVTLSLATSESWKDKMTGEQKELTEWHRVVFFKRPAEIIGEFARKGAKLYIEGQIKTRKWQDNQGQDRYSTEIMGREFQFLSSAPEDAGQSQGQSRSTAPAAQPAPQQAPQGAPGGNFDFDDDIPF